MKRLLLASALLLWSAPARATCNAVNDHYYWFGGNDYNHVLNGYGTSLDCWSTPSSLGTVSITSGSCGFSSTQGFTFSGWSPALEQTFSTGSGNSGATWSLQYELDFDDPNNSSASFINVLVYADNQLVAYDAYDGSNTDVMCSPRTININSSLSNKSVLVRVVARTYYTNVLIRIRGVGLWQHYRY
jgi:hypothetical protein